MTKWLVGLWARLGEPSRYLICMKGDLILQTDFLLFFFLIEDQKAGIELSLNTES